MARSALHFRKAVLAAHLSPGLGPQGRGRGRDRFRGHEAQRDEHPRPPFLSWGPSSSPVSSLLWTVFPPLRTLRDPKVLPWRAHPWGRLTYPGGLCRRRGTRNTPCSLKEANSAVVSCPQKPRGRVRSRLWEPPAVLSPQPTGKRRPDSSGLHHDLDSLRGCRKECGPDTGTAALRAEQRTCTHTRSPAREAGDDPLVLCELQTTRASVPSGGSHTRVSRRTGRRTGQGGQPSYTARAPGPTQLGRAALLGARPAPALTWPTPPAPPTRRACQGRGGRPLSGPPAWGLRGERGPRQGGGGVPLSRRGPGGPGEPHDELGLVPAVTRTSCPASLMFSGCDSKSTHNRGTKNGRYHIELGNDTQNEEAAYGMREDVRTPCLRQGLGAPKT